MWIGLVISGFYESKSFILDCVCKLYSLLSFLTCVKIWLILNLLTMDYVSVCVEKLSGEHNLGIEEDLEPASISSFESFF